MPVGGPGGQDGGVGLGQGPRALPTAPPGEQANDPANAWRFLERCFLDRLLPATRRGRRRRRCGTVGFGAAGVGLRPSGGTAGLLTRSDQGTDVAGRLYPVGLGPGQLFFQGEAATVAFPALRGGHARAGAVLAREGPAGVLRLGCGGDGQGEAEHDHQVADQGQHQDGVTRSNPQPCPDPTPHERFSSPGSRTRRRNANCTPCGLPRPHCPPPGGEKVASPIAFASRPSFASRFPTPATERLRRGLPPVRPGCTLLRASGRSSPPGAMRG
jgi:hypothetical protein